VKQIQLFVFPKNWYPLHRVLPMSIVL